MATSRDESDPKLLAGLALGALGVVYGDIGTSPLYALKEIFLVGHVTTSPEHVLGVLSLVFWTLTVVIALKYVALILRADNHGEGGLIAMMALALQAVGGRRRLRRFVFGVGLFGTAIFFGDAVITPAISVVSAVEGLGVAAPALDKAVIPIALVVLTLLFASQRFGTAKVGRLFGPVTLVWFVLLAALGLPHILRSPQVLAAINPAHALGFLAEAPWEAFVALGAVVLVVTGGEALYADLGHFGKRPIRIAWYLVVMPALVLNYFGQGALLLEQPEAIRNPFFLMAPEWARLGLVVMATAATVIASQALITAAFSVTRQAIQLGLLPRMRVLHTSVRASGQIYVPAINWLLYALVVLAVGLFGSATALASAYGIAVTLDMTLTTVLTFFVVRYSWKLAWPVCVAATGGFLVIDLAFFGANTLKVVEGGWFPLLIGAALLGLMTTWVRGRRLMTERLQQDALNLREFLDALFVEPPQRVAGTAIFLAAEPDMVPNALLHNLKHNKVLHSHNLFVRVLHHELPWIGFEQRAALAPLGRDCWQVTLNFGFMNDPDVPRALALLNGRGVPLDDMETSYFLSRDTVAPALEAGFAPWRRKLFSAMHRNAAAAADFLHLPANRVVELGTRIQI